MFTMLDDFSYFETIVSSSKESYVQRSDRPGKRTQRIGEGVHRTHYYDLLLS